MSFQAAAGVAAYRPTTKPTVAVVVPRGSNIYINHLEDGWIRLDICLPGGTNDACMAEADLDPVARMERKLAERRAAPADLRARLASAHDIGVRTIKRLAECGVVEADHFLSREVSELSDAFCGPTKDRVKKARLNTILVWATLNGRAPKGRCWQSITLTEIARTVGTTRLSWLGKLTLGQLNDCPVISPEDLGLRDAGSYWHLPSVDFDESRSIQREVDTVRDILAPLGVRLVIRGREKQVE